MFLYDFGEFFLFFNIDEFLLRWRLLSVGDIMMGEGEICVWMFVFLRSDLEKGFYSLEEILILMNDFE